MVVQIDQNEFNKKLQKKLFLILVITGCIANMIGFLSNAFLFGMSFPTIVCAICEIVIILCGIVGIGLGKQKFAETIMVLVLALFEFPFLFYVYGANMGVYLILGIVALAIYIPRPYHVPSIIGTIMLDTAVILLSYYVPCTLEKMTEVNQFATMLCSYVIVSIATAVILCMLIHQYVEQREQLFIISKKWEYAANRDALTGVYNRRYLIDTLNDWMNTEDKHFLAVLIDIDDFKKINDTYGHVYGDMVLEELSNIMKSEIKGKGIVARYGGEEFMLLFENADIELVKNSLEAIKEGLIAYSRSSRNITITFSAGIEEYHAEKKIDELFHGADTKLYMAKNSGKNKIVY